MRFFIAVIFCLLPIIANAACGGSTLGSSPNWTAYDNSYDCVNLAVNTTASAGETVNIPAGGGSVSWSTTLTVTRGKKIVGPGRASLTISSGAGNSLIVFSPSAAAIAADDVFEVSGLTLDMNAAASGYAVAFSASSNLTPLTKIKIYENTFTDYKVAIHAYGLFYGVIYSNIFNETTANTISVRTMGAVKEGCDGCGTWDVASNTYGLAEGLYLEDNAITMSAGGYLSYCEGGGYVKFRYNDITAASSGSFGAMVDLHPAMNERCPCFGTEFYGNDVTAESSMDISSFRGGQGIWAFNKISGSANSYGLKVYTDNLDGACDACKSNPRKVTPTNSYTVNNRLNGSTAYNFYESMAEIVVDEDYFNFVSSGYNGSTGTGCGTLANRPASPALTGTGYLATNQACTSLSNDQVGASPAAQISGTLYYWTGSAWATKWTPLTYPHPLRGASGDTTPPTVSSPLPSGAQAYSSNPQNATLQVTTNENATCRMMSSDDGGSVSTPYSSMTDTFTTTGSTSHSEVKSLGAGASYSYWVQCVDGSGNDTETATQISFSINSPPSYRKISGSGTLPSIN